VYNPGAHASLPIIPQIFAPVKYFFQILSNSKISRARGRPKFPRKSNFGELQAAAGSNSAAVKFSRTHKLRRLSNFKGFAQLQRSTSKKYIYFFPLYYIITLGKFQFLKRKKKRKKEKRTPTILVGALYYLGVPTPFGARIALVSLGVSRD